MQLAKVVVVFRKPESQTQFPLQIVQTKQDTYGNMLQITLKMYAIASCTYIPHGTKGSSNGIVFLLISFRSFPTTKQAYPVSGTKPIVWIQFHLLRGLKQRNFLLFCFHQSRIEKR